MTKKVRQDTELYFIRVTPIPRLLYRTEILTINIKIKTDIKHVKSDLKGYRQRSSDLQRNYKLFRISNNVIDYRCMKK
jgi:hypothetical protein